MSQAKLPIGIQNFEEIISEGYTYVDKTALIYKLITEGLYYFLQRPRRFGKSLLLSTLDALFSGKRDLFKGLWIDESDWEWISYPVLYLDMSTIVSITSEHSNYTRHFELNLIRALHSIAKDHNVSIEGSYAAHCLEDLIEKLSVEKNVVVLIDEYDKPLTDNIDNPEARGIERILQDFYTILKADGKHIQFLLLTGVTTVSNIFSSINNLHHITMHSEYSTLLGYTEQELEHYFQEDIEELTRSNNFSQETCHEKIKEWYNGYKFSEDAESVYNPFAILRLLAHRRFKNYWFETGTPTFLIDLIKKREFDISNLDSIVYFFYIKRLFWFF